MLRLCQTFIVLAALISGMNGLAQESNVSVGSKVSPAQIREWLEGRDSRLVAWGAYFASKSDDVANHDLYVTIMTGRMAQWFPPPNEAIVQDPGSSFKISRRAMSEILYALIEENESVPVVGLTPVMSEFPTETLILAARLPAREATPFLEGWYEKRRQLRAPGAGSYADQAVPFAGMAAMLLAKAPPPGFAASVLDESSERLSFWVADGMWENWKWRGGSGPACKDPDQVLHPSPEEVEAYQWPPPFRYRLQNSDSPYSGTLLVDVGGERISYRRISMSTWPTSCYQAGFLSDETRHHILAELLGVSDRDMPWPVHQDVIHIERSNEGFLPALTTQIDAEKLKFHAIVNALQEKGYLTNSEAETVLPQLLVTVNDARSSSYDDRPQPLPKWVSSDPKVSIAYDTR